MVRPGPACSAWRRGSRRRTKPCRPSHLVPRHPHRWRSRGPPRGGGPAPRLHEPPTPRRRNPPSYRRHPPGRTRSPAPLPALRPCLEWTFRSGPSARPSLVARAVAERASAPSATWLRSSDSPGSQPWPSPAACTSDWCGRPRSSRPGRPGRSWPPRRRLRSRPWPRWGLRFRPGPRRPPRAHW